MTDRLFFDETVRLQSRERLPVRHGPNPGLRVWNAVAQAWRRHRSRQRITELDGHLLKDIGVSFAEAEAEANKSFWRT